MKLYHSISRVDKQWPLYPHVRTRPGSSPGRKIDVINKHLKWFYKSAVKGILWYRRWSPPSIRIIPNTLILLRKGISNHETSKQAFKFQSGPSRQCLVCHPAALRIRCMGCLRHWTTNRIWPWALNASLHNRRLILNNKLCWLSTNVDMCRCGDIFLTTCR